MKRVVVRWLKRLVTLVAVAGLTFLGIRAYDSQRGPELQPWHLYVPAELRGAELDRTEWQGYLEHEAGVFAGVRSRVTEQLPPAARVALNRYFEGSPLYPAHFARDWNRSYVMEPAAPPAGAVVLLHGLTDSPYSTRHIAELYRERGFLAVGIRLPGHGTVPAGLTDVTWQDWAAATRLAVREARRRVPAPAPLHLVGYSNGGALALQYGMEALDDPTLARPDRLVLISPMIGVTGFARLAGFAGVPALLPRFAKAAWLDIVPEFNPFKYNSFPVNGAVQSHRLTQVLQDEVERHVRGGRLTELAPVLTFQSVTDATVSTPAIVAALYAYLPANGSELVLFDVNRSVRFELLLRPVYAQAVERVLPVPPRAYRMTVIGNLGPDDRSVVERSTGAGETRQDVRPLGLVYPKEVFSLSHVAIPFPVWDSLYGLEPVGEPEFGVSLGTIAARGERGALILSLDGLLRITSNPFFPYVLDRISEGIDNPAPRLSLAASAGP